MKIEDLNISVALLQQLKTHNISELQELAKFTSEDIMKWKNLGRRSLEELITIMKSNNIRFSQ